MPAIPREMSWLSPKRRRTTGNLKAVPNGQVKTENGTSLSPKSPTFQRSITSTSNRPTSQSTVGSSIVSVEGDGNLFYAYARKGDDLKSRYLLTFASASIANEWWSLVQNNFPDASRPGPQLFSFTTDDLLSSAWKHPALFHLRSKWMYISFSDTSNNGVGGAAQGIIPVQDVDGNMLGGGASTDEWKDDVRQEAKEVKREVGKLEDHFEQMMEAMERNTSQVALLAGKQAETEGKDREVGASSSKGGGGYFDMDALTTQFSRMNEILAKNSENVENLAKRQYDNEWKLRRTIEGLASKQHNDYLDMQQLSSHLNRIQEMMESSAAERRDSARDLAAPTIDFSPLTDRLEKVQDAIEQNSGLIKQLLNEDSEDSKDKSQSPALDVKPLTQHLERIKTAVEQQGEHMKALVGFASGETEGSDAGNGALAPLGEHLEQIYNAIDEGNRNAKEASQKLDLSQLSTRFDAMLEHAQKNSDSTRLLHQSIEDGNKHAREASATSNVTPLAKHLESLLDHAKKTNDNMRSLNNSVKEGNKHARESSQKNDFAQLEKHLEELLQHSKNGNDHMERMLDTQTATREVIETSNRQAQDIAQRSDVTQLNTHFSELIQHSKTSSEHVQRILEAQVASREAIETSNKQALDALEKSGASQMKDHLEQLLQHSKDSNSHLERMLEAQTATREAVEANGGELDFTPLADHMDALKEATDRNSDAIKEMLESKKDNGSRSIDLSPLTEHLQAIRSVTEQQAEHMSGLLESQQASAARSADSSGVDFTPMTDRLTRIHSLLEQQGERREKSPGTGDGKFLMNALTSHMSKIQGLTEQNANHVKALRDSQSSSQTKVQSTVSETSEQIRTLVKRNEQNDSRLRDSEARMEAQNSQMRELMSGQREMVEVMRQLTKSIVAQNKGDCDHIVVPPPRKMGRKVVGFVYDAKDGVS